jgi:hypothetical protein
MESSSDAVTIQVLDDAKPMTSCSLLDGSAEITETSTRLRGVHRIALSLLGRLEQSRGNGRDLSHGHADPGIREVSVELGRYVEVDEVTITQLTRQRRDAVSSLVVHADTGETGKPIGHTGSRPSSVASEYLSAKSIKLAGCGTRGNGTDHRSTRFSDNPTSTNQCIEILLLVDRHEPTLDRPVCVLRLHILTIQGFDDRLSGSYRRAEEPITITHTEVNRRRRLALLAQAQRSENVAETRRVIGISRTRYDEWKNRRPPYPRNAAPHRYPGQLSPGGRRPRRPGLS